MQNKDFSVSHKMVSTYEELAAFKNSKYVFSDAYAVFSEIKSALNFKDNKKVLFIGLPCQVAALRKLFRDNENLLLVEVVCHGTTPVSYLKQHIDMLSSKYGKTAMRMSFRDPDAYTYTFTLLYMTKKESCSTPNVQRTATPISSAIIAPCRIEKTVITAALQSRSAMPTSR